MFNKLAFGTNFLYLHFCQFHEKINAKLGRAHYYFTQQSLFFKSIFHNVLVICGAHFYKNLLLTGTYLTSFIFIFAYVKISVEYWKTCREFECCFKESTKTKNQIAKQLTFQQFLSRNSNLFLLIYEIYPYLHLFIYCTKHSFCFFPRDKGFFPQGRASHFVRQNPQIIKANFLFSILVFHRH